MSNNNDVDVSVSVFSMVAGFQDATDLKNELSKHGSDFSQSRGQVDLTVSKLHPKRLDLVVSKIIDETKSTKTFRMISADGKKLPPFQAGQYINLYVDIQGVSTARPYAISSSSRCLDHYDLTVKRAAPGYVTHYLLDEIEEGARMKSSGPMGTFYHNPLFKCDELVFLAGGSGIAPARSMIKEIAEREIGLKFTLVYLSSFDDDIIYEGELAELDEKNSFLQYYKIVTRPSESYTGLTGRLTKDKLQSIIGEIDGKMFYICGPTPFNQACEASLSSLNVKSRCIRIEANGPPKNPEILDDWPVGAQDSKRVTVAVKGCGNFEADVNEPLLNSLERNGYSVENACRSGECSLCRVKIERGEVYNPQEARLRKTDSRYGWCHSCVAFPIEDIEVSI